VWLKKKSLPKIIFTLRLIAIWIYYKQNTAFSAKIKNKTNNHYKGLKKKPLTFALSSSTKQMLISLFDLVSYACINIE
jgi:hypothetical protein